MQFTPLDKKARAEWQELLRPANATHISAAAILFLSSALALPLCASEAVAGLYLLYAAVFYYMLTHSMWAVVAVAIPGVALFGVSALVPTLPHPFLMPAVYAALILGGIGGGFLLIHCCEKKYLPLLLLPVAAYVIVALTASPLKALLVLIPVALSLILGHGILTCRPQTPVLICLAGALAAFGVLAYLIWYWLFSHIPFPAPGPFTYLGVSVRDAMSAFYRNAAELYAQQGMVLALSETDIANLAAMVGNILPGLFLAGCGILAFVTYRINLRVLNAWGTLTRVPLRIGAMTVSPTAAALFVVSYLLATIAGNGLFATVCENLALVLEPALVLVGVSALLARDAQRRSTLSLILLVGLAILLLNYPTLALALFAFVGAVRILLAAALSARAKDGRK